MPDRSIRKPIFVICMLCKRSVEQKQNILLRFIDHKKAFDKVHHSQLTNMLKQSNIEDQDLHMIQNTYFLQKSASHLTLGISG